MRYAVLPLLILPVMPTLLYAHDLGVYGRVWGIKEVNLKEVIAMQLSHVDYHAIDLRLKHSVKTFGQHLKPNQLPVAKVTGTTYVNPAVALTKNIIVNGRVLYRKGTWINPLKVVRPQQDMLFFDAHSKAQFNFALAALKAHPYKLMLVETTGNPIVLSDKIHRPIYYASKAIIQRFDIQKVPSLLGVGTGSHQYDLAVSTFATPYQVNLIKACWSGCRVTQGKQQENQKTRQGE